jgi:adenine-specific DNA-methyltransferase
MSLQVPLFADLPAADAPETEGIKYAGSKLKLIPRILEIARKVNARSVLDGFSGTTRVSQALARRGYNVMCNDHAVWSEVFGNCYLKGKAPHEYRELIGHLNAVPAKAGWFTEHYGGDSENGEASPKRPWQCHNTMKLDAIRSEIESLSLNTVDKHVALTSLILAMDQVDSTIGHFVSYLREWSPRSYKPLQLKVPAIVESQPGQLHSVHRSDIFSIANSTKVDLAYYDPPYGSNNEKMPPSRVRYASYYHVWTTICLHDNPKLFGKVNRRADTSDTIANSPFEDFRKGADGKFIAVESIRRLLNATQAKHIILSYSSGGRATSEELNDAIGSCGKLIEVIELDYKRNVMADMRWTNEWLRDAETPNREFLFLIARD